MNVIHWLRTPTATLIVLCSALLAQLPHAADVFRLIVMGDGVWPVLHSYTYAVALELAVLLFVVQRRNVESYLFAAVSILVNLSYYYLHGVALFTVAALPAWLVSIALPAAIAQYSHLIAAATTQSAQHAAPPRTWRWRFWRKAATPDVSPATPAAQTPPIQHSTATPDEIGDIIPATPTPVTLRAVAPIAPDVAQRSSADIAAQLGVTRQAVDGWKRRGTLRDNIARRLPEVAAPTTNGNGGAHD